MTGRGDTIGTSTAVSTSLPARARRQLRWRLPLLLSALFVASLMAPAAMAAPTSVYSGASAHSNTALSTHSSVLPGSASSHATAVSSGGAPPSLPTATSTAPTAPHPAASSGRGTFFTNSLVPQPTTPYCPYTYFCWNDTNAPSANFTTNGVSGIAYTAYTNQSPCAAMAGNTTVPDAATEVGFVASSNWGSTWSSPLYLGNPSCTGLDANYSSAMDPSLTSLSNGTFVLAYIEYNYTRLTTYSYAAPPENLYCSNLYHLAYDRLVVSYSYNGGVSWTTPSVVDSPSLGSCPTIGFPDLRPTVTAIGNTIYLAWMSTSRPLGSCCGVTETANTHFTVSNDSGATWSPSITVPVTSGTDATYSDSTSLAVNPNLLVDPSGRVFLAYVTAFSSSYSSTKGADVYSANVVVGVSTDNGTTFAYTTATKTAGWFTTYYPSYYLDPAPVLAYSAMTGTVFLAYAGQAQGNFCYNDGIYGSFCGPYERAETIWLQNSTNGGSSWSAPSNPLPSSLIDPNNGFASSAYNPSMAVDSAGTLHLQFAFANDAVCYSYMCGLGQEYYMNSTDGGNSWTVPYIVYPFASIFDGSEHYFYDEYWQGSATSLITDGTQVMLAWTLESCPTASYCYGGYNGGAQVVVSTLYEGAGITLTFSETGLNTGVSWSALAQGNDFSATAGTNIVISGVPPSTTIQFNVPEINASYGILYTPVLSVASPAAFATSTTVTATFTEQFLVNILTVPTIDHFWWTGAEVNYAMSPSPGASWVAPGSVQTDTITPAAWAFCYYCLNLTFQSWTGSGNGSVNSLSYNITYTVNGPINETANFNLIGWCINPRYFSGGCDNVSYPLAFVESGLPNGTTWGITVTNQSSGAPNSYTSSSDNITLLVGTTPLQFTMWTVPSASSGQFWLPTTSVIDPVNVLTNPTVPVSYTLGGLSSTSFTTTFNEVGLPNATAWSLELGSSSFGLATNSTTMSLAGGSSYSVNASYVYLESGVGYYATSVTVTPYVINETVTTATAPATYTVDGSGVVTVHFSPMYYATVTATVGGSVSPSSQWVLSGQSITLGETAASGYHFVGWTGTGAGAVTTGTSAPAVTPRGPIAELATFRPNAPPTWNVTVVGTGLPAGVAVTVTIGGTTYSGIGGFKVGNLTNGTYSVTAPVVYLNGTDSERYVPSAITSSLDLTAGELDLIANGTLTVAYQGQAAVNLIATPNGQISVPASGAGAYWWNLSEAQTLTALPASGFQLVSWNGTGAGSVNSTSLSITVTPLGPITETAQFLPVPIVPVTFFSLAVSETGLPGTVAWSISVGNNGASGTGSTLTVSGLNGTYTLNAPPVYPSAGVRWVSDAVNVSKSVTANSTFTVQFYEQFYLSVNAGSGGSATGSGWYNASAAVTLSATPASGQEFLSWNGSGPGWSNTTVQSPTVTLTGPLTVQASFAPIPAPPVKSTSTSGSSMTDELLSFGLLIALLVVGLAVGMMLARRGGRQPPMQEYSATGPETVEAPAEGEAPAEAPAIYDEGAPPSS